MLAKVFAIYNGLFEKATGVLLTKASLLHVIRDNKRREEI